MKKDIFTILYRLDKKIYGEQISPNKYLATVTLICSMLFGVLLGGSSFLGGMFNWEIHTSLSASLVAVIYLVGYNIAESIIAADTAKVAILRSLMITGILALGFVLGIVGSVIVLAILTIIIVFYIFLAVVFGEKGGSKIILNDGTVLSNKKSDILGTGASYDGNDGKRYHTDDGQTFRQE